MKRRGVWAAGAGLAMLALVRPASATPEEMAAAIKGCTGGAAPQEGKVSFDIAQLIEARSDGVIQFRPDIYQKDGVGEVAAAY